MAPGPDHRQLDLRQLLTAAEAVPPLDAIDIVADELGRTVDAREVSLLLANLSGDAVMRMSHVTVRGEMRDGRNERAQALALAGSVHERVLLDQVPDVRRGRAGWDVLLPVTERGDAIGILALTLPERPGEDVVAYLESAAHALAYVLIASRRHTDVYERAQRDTPFSLAAEIQRRLLPSSYSVETGSFTLAGWLEPASDVGGDTFDYSIDREYLYASITDAMGHSTEAALLATLTVASLRNSRRALASPSEQAAAANADLLESSRADQFVSGLLLRLRLADGRIEIVNAGHPPPFLLRSGTVGLVDLEADPALGVTEAPYATHVVQLEADDRLVLLTDGFLERNAANVDIAATLEAGAACHPREVVRALSADVLRVTGRSLRDDATILCLDWYGPQGRRDATAGASRARTGTG